MLNPLFFSTKLKSLFKLLLLLLTTSILIPGSVLAVVNPQTSSVGITATVPDTHPPSTPVLISPANHSTINTQAPNFIFQPSTDNVGFGEYELYLDGDNKMRDHIFHQNTTTITTSAETNLTDGLHTWKIRAIDTSNNYKDSATWTFTIDTTPPLILITQIAEHTTNLSSADPATTQANPTFTTTDQTPIFTGTSEAHATLIISLSSNTQNYSFTTIAASDASFTITPTSKLGYNNYTVSISATDTANNTTALPSFTLTIKSPPTITISLPSPLPTITLPTITLPTISLPSLPQLQPRIPEALQASPIITFACSLWPWLIVLILLLYIIYLHYKYHQLKQQLKQIKNKNKPDQTYPTSIP